MLSDVKVPRLPETVQCSEIENIYVSKGQQVQAGDMLFDVETEKVVLEVVAESSGIIDNIMVSKGGHVSSDQVVMSLKVSELQEAPSCNEKTEYTEVITEKLVTDDSGRVLLEDVVGNSLFDQRGVICGVVGFILGIVFGGLGTAIILG